MSDNKLKFGISKDTKTTNNTPILVATKVENNAMFPNGWKFPKARLVNIITNPEFELKSGEKTSILQFVFIDNDKRQYIHTEWQLDADDAKVDVKLEGMNVRIAHIYSAIFGNIPENGIGSDAIDFNDFFNKVKDTFNLQTIQKGDKQVIAYTQVELFIKVTYYKKNLGFPLSPNFLEKVIPNSPCKILTINTTYDTLEPTTGASNSGIPGISGTAPSGDDLPSFEESYS